MANCPPFNPFLKCFSFPSSPPRPPSINGLCKSNCTSKVTKCGKRGRCNSSSNDNDCCQPEQEVKLRCPPLPPCSFKCVPNCKDLPAERLKNVDILEELCYYTQGESNGEMDCYTVDCCGNVEKVNEDGCCCGDDDDAGNGGQPVKYSRRQRFSFNDKHPDRSSCADPWPFKRKDEGHCCSGNDNNHNNTGAGNCNSQARGAKPQCIGRNMKNETGNICCNRKSICCPFGPTNPEDMFPAESGVYYYDQKSGAFVPEKELPRVPEVITKIVPRSAVEDYELVPDPVDEVECPKPIVQPIIQPIIMPEGQSSCCQPPCGPCAMPPYNPCCPPPQCNPCNPCPPFYNPCMPCGPPNPMCGGGMPMVVPMCPQQDMMGMLPPFNPAFMSSYKKKGGTGTKSSSGTTKTKATSSSKSSGS